MDTETQLPAGWYADPADPTHYRYWTGEQWTTDVVARDEVDVGVQPEPRPLPTFDDPADAEPPAPPARRRRRPVLLGLGALLIAGGAAYALWPTEASDHTITGEVRVPGSNGGEESPCTTGPNGSDIHAGTEVSVTNGRGDVLGTGQLGEGEPDRTACVFAYTVSDVPDAAVYTVRVADRRPARMTQGEAEAADWQMDLRLN